MCPESIPENSKSKQPQNTEDLSSYRFLLGDFGIQILAAIAKGAKTENAIMTLSGVPLACVKGRTPVLQNLKLIQILNINHYEVTKKGIKFLRMIRGTNV